MVEMAVPFKNCVMVVEDTFADPLFEFMSDFDMVNEDGLDGCGGKVCWRS